MFNLSIMRKQNIFIAVHFSERKISNTFSSLFSIFFLLFFFFSCAHHNNASIPDSLELSHNNSGNFLTSTVIKEGFSNFTHPVHHPSLPILYYLNDKAGTKDLWEYQFSSGKDTKLLSGHDISQMQIDTAGKYLAFRTNEFDAQGDIALFDLKAKKILSLARSPCAEFLPEFSDDGNRIFFTRDCDGIPNIFQMNIHNKSEEQITLDGALLAKILRGRNQLFFIDAKRQLYTRNLLREDALDQPVFFDFGFSYFQSKKIQEIALISHTIPFLDSQKIEEFENIGTILVTFEPDNSNDNNSSFLFPIFRSLQDKKTLRTGKPFQLPPSVFGKQLFLKSDSLIFAQFHNHYYRLMIYQISDIDTGLHSIDESSISEKEKEYLYYFTSYFNSDSRVRLFAQSQLALSTLRNKNFSDFDYHIYKISEDQDVFSKTMVTFFLIFKNFELNVYNYKNKSHIEHVINFLESEQTLFLQDKQFTFMRAYTNLYLSRLYFLLGNPSKAIEKLKIIEIIDPDTSEYLLIALKEQIFLLSPLWTKEENRRFFLNAFFKLVKNPGYQNKFLDFWFEHLLESKPLNFIVSEGLDLVLLLQSQGFSVDYLRLLLYRSFSVRQEYHLAYLSLEEFIHHDISFLNEKDLQNIFILLLSMKKEEEAIAFYRRIQQKQTYSDAFSSFNESAMQVFVNQAVEAEKNRDFEKSFSLLFELYKIQNIPVWLADNLIRVAQLSKHYHELLEYTKTRLENEKKNEHLKYVYILMLSYNDTHPFSDTEKKLTELLAYNENYSYSYGLLAWIYTQRFYREKSITWFNKAVYHYEQAKQLLGSADKTTLAKWELNLAHIHFQLAHITEDQANFSKSFHYYIEREKYLLPFENDYSELVYHQQFGRAAFRIGEWDIALEQLKKTYLLAQQLQLQNIVEQSLLQITTLYKINEQTDLAQFYFNKLKALNFHAATTNNLDEIIHDNDTLLIEHLNKVLERTEKLSASSEISHLTIKGDSSGSMAPLGLSREQVLDLEFSLQASKTSMRLKKDQLLKKEKILSSLIAKSGEGTFSLERIINLHNLSVLQVSDFHYQEAIKNITKAKEISVNIRPDLLFFVEQKEMLYQFLNFFSHQAMDNNITFIFEKISQHPAFSLSLDDLYEKLSNAHPCFVIDTLWLHFYAAHFFTYFYKDIERTKAKPIQHTLMSLASELDLLDGKVQKRKFANIYISRMNSLMTNLKKNIVDYKSMSSQNKIIPWFEFYTQSSTVTVFDPANNVRLTENRKSENLTQPSKMYIYDTFLEEQRLQLAKKILQLNPEFRGPKMWQRNLMRQVSEDFLHKNDFASGLIWLEMSMLVDTSLYQHTNAGEDLNAQILSFINNHIIQIYSPEQSPLQFIHPKMHGFFDNEGVIKTGFFSSVFTKKRNVIYITKNGADNVIFLRFHEDSSKIIPTQIQTTELFRFIHERSLFSQPITALQDTTNKKQEQDPEFIFETIFSLFLAEKENYLLFDADLFSLSFIQKLHSAQKDKELLHFRILPSILELVTHDTFEPLYKDSVPIEELLKNTVVFSPIPYENIQFKKPAVFSAHQIFLKDNSFSISIDDILKNNHPYSLSLTIDITDISYDFDISFRNQLYESFLHDTYLHQIYFKDSIADEFRNKTIKKIFSSDDTPDVIFGVFPLTLEEKSARMKKLLNYSISRGASSFNEKKYSDAYLFFQRALECIKQIQNFPTPEKLYELLFTSAVQIKRYEDAVMYGKNRIQLVKSKKQEAFLKRELAHVYFLNSQKDLSLQYYRETLSIYKKDADTDNYFYTIILVAQLFESQGDIKRSLEFLNEGLSHSRQIQNFQYIQKFLKHIAAILLLKTGQYSLALTHYQEAMNIINKRMSENKPLMIQTLIEISRVQRSMGNFQKAESCINDAQKIFSNYYQSANTAKIQTTESLLSEEDILLSLLFEKAALFWYLGRYDSSLGLLKEIKNTAKSKSKKRVLMQAHSITGLIFLEKGDTVSAETELLISKELAEQLDDSLEISNQLNNLGKLFLDQKNLKKAKAHFDAATAIDTEKNNRFGLSYDYRHKSDIENQLGNRDLALDFVKKSYNISEQIGDTYNIMQTQLQMAKLYFKHDNELAKKYFLLALKNAAELQNTSVILEIFSFMFTLAAEPQKKDIANAYLYYVLSVSLSPEQKPQWLSQYHEMVTWNLNHLLKTKEHEHFFSLIHALVFFERNHETCTSAEEFLSFFRYINPEKENAYQNFETSTHKLSDSLFELLQKKYSIQKSQDALNKNEYYLLTTAWDDTFFFILQNNTETLFHLQPLPKAMSQQIASESITVQSFIQMYQYALQNHHETGWYNTIINDNYYNPIKKLFSEMKSFENNKNILLFSPHLYLISLPLLNIIINSNNEFLYEKTDIIYTDIQSIPSLHEQYQLKNQFLSLYPIKRLIFKNTSNDFYMNLEKKELLQQHFVEKHESKQDFSYLHFIGHSKDLNSILSDPSFQNESGLGEPGIAFFSSCQTTKIASKKIIIGNISDISSLSAALFSKWFYRFSKSETILEALRKTRDTIRKHHPHPANWAGTVIFFAPAYH